MENIELSIHSRHKARIRVLIIHEVLFVVLLIVLNLCFCRGEDMNNPANEAETILKKSKQKWNWVGIDKKHGIPTIEVAKLNTSGNSCLSNIYRIVVLNHEAVYRKPITFTYSCIAHSEGLVFIENDLEAQGALKSCSVKTIYDLFDTLRVFNVLRGYEIQIGVPSSLNPWPFTPKHGPSFEPQKEDQKNPSNWAFSVNTVENGWIINCSLVSIDDFSTYRYEIKAIRGEPPMFIRKKMVFSSPPSI